MDNVSLSGSTVVVTGSNTGIGKETARELARRGARVILACRSVEKANAARDDIIADTRNANVIVKQVDLSSLESIKHFADDYNQTETRLDILVNNAAVITSQRELTKDGFEMIFGVNHLGGAGAHTDQHGRWLIDARMSTLCDDNSNLKSSAPSRVVTVSSLGHEMYSLDFDDLQTERGWSWLKSYGRSKTANILFSQHLAMLLNGTRVTTYSLHPGEVDTEITRDIADTCGVKCFHCFGPCIGKGLVSSAKGALTTLYCCVEPKLADETGLYYSGIFVSSDQRRKRAKNHATNPEFAEQLWNTSRQLCGLR